MPDPILPGAERDQAAGRGELPERPSDAHRMYEDGQADAIDRLWAEIDHLRSEEQHWRLHHDIKTEMLAEARSALAARPFLASQAADEDGIDPLESVPGEVWMDGSSLGQMVEPGAAEPTVLDRLRAATYRHDLTQDGAVIISASLAANLLAALASPTAPSPVVPEEGPCS